jgi:hypothetical protein
MDRHLCVVYSMKTGFGAQTILISNKHREPFLPKLKQLSRKSANPLSFGGEVNVWSCFHTSSFPWLVIKHSNKSLASNYKSFSSFGHFKKDHKLFIGLRTWVK